MVKRLLISLALWLGVNIAAHAETAQMDITSGDVYRSLIQLSDDVNTIRLEMGIEQHAIPAMEVYDAQPREVYFQAQTVFEKLSRLHFDLLRDRPKPPQIVTADATSGDVLALIQQADALVTSIYRYMNISSTVPNPDIDTYTQKTPTDVYILMIGLSRVLNGMIDHQFSPAEAYQQVTYAVSIASTILLEKDVHQAMGDTSIPLEPRKTPTDVYRRLITVNNRIHQVINHHNGTCLTLGEAEMHRTGVNPGDVYDLASLVVAELSYLRNLINTSSAPHAPYYPGKKWPSHVYQRVGQLESQIKHMLAGVKS